MEEELKNKDVKNKLIIGGICIAVIAFVIIFSTVLYNFFCNINKKIEERTIETVANNNQDEEEITIDSETEEEEIDISIEEEVPAEEENKQEENKKEEQKKEEKKQQEQNKVSNYPYYIKVNYRANTVTIYAKDKEGNFTVPVKAMVCSTGRSTPRSGVYRTPQKSQWGNLIGSYGQYCTRITGQILFHSVPYLTKYDKTSLEYWEYDRLGETRSLGCIRLTVRDAKWIYDNCPLGTSVEFYSSSNPGPLGKPPAQKISNAGYPYYLWDPTDPDPNNPWRNKDKENNTANNTTGSDKNETTNTTNSTNTTGNNTTNSTTNNTTNSTTGNNTTNNTTTNTTNSTTGNNTTNNVNTNTSNNTSSNATNTTNTSTNITTTTNTTNSNTTNTTGNQTSGNNSNTVETKKITITNVVGKTESEAKKNLTDLNVKIEYKSDTTKTNGTVISQSLKAGSLVKNGTSIILTVNKIKDVENENK